MRKMKDIVNQAAQQLCIYLILAKRTYLIRWFTNRLLVFIRGIRLKKHPMPVMVFRRPASN